MAYRTDFEKNNYIIKELARGMDGIVYASIKKLVADQVISALNDSANPLTLPEAKDRLRAAIEAAKICKSATSRFRLEIQALRVLHPGNYRNIVRCTSSDPNYGWLTLEPLRGRNSRHFRELIKSFKPPNPTPVSLAWHFIHDFAEALMAMNEHECAHMDIAERNIMLRPSGVYQDYPDVVVVDLGKACKQPLDVRVVDLNKLYDVLHWSFETMTRRSRELYDAVQSFKGYRVRKGAPGAEHYRRFLIQLRDQALRARDRSYQPLPSEMVAYFEEHGQMVSDEDLGEVFPDLA